jgi:hypothetical protein
LIGQRREEFNVTDQMGEAKLNGDIVVVDKLLVG